MPAINAVLFPPWFGLLEFDSSMVLEGLDVSYALGASEPTNFELPRADTPREEVLVGLKSEYSTDSRSLDGMGSCPMLSLLDRSVVSSPTSSECSGFIFNCVFVAFRPVTTVFKLVLALVCVSKGLTECEVAVATDEENVASGCLGTVWPGNGSSLDP